MSKHLLFYETAVPVNAERHKATRVTVGEDFGFTADTNSVPVVGAEFAKTAFSYPIVFAGADTDVMPAAVLGMGNNRNTFLDGQGNWTEGYIPGFVRRYPFAFAQAEGSTEAALVIDESHSGVSEQGDGNRLFDDEGAHTPYLQEVLKFGQAYQQQFSMTAQFSRRLAELELLQPMQANFEVEGHAPLTMTGFQTVDREKFKALDAQTVSEFFANDALEAIYLHLASLTHFANIAQRSVKKI